jgi:hypothetical protein
MSFPPVACELYLGYPILQLVPSHPRDFDCPQTVDRGKKSDWQIVASPLSFEGDLDPPE